MKDAHFCPLFLWYIVNRDSDMKQKNKEQYEGDANLTSLLC